MSSTTDTPITIRPALEALEQAFDQLRQRFGLAEGVAPVITIQSAGRKRATGWFWPEMWTGESPEINLSAEHLARGYEEAMETLIHEMAHWANWVNDVKDCNKAQYHNRQFKEMAQNLGLHVENLGLHVEKMGRHGWADTSLTPELKDMVYGLTVNKDAFGIARLIRRGEKAPTKMKLWQCGCGVKIRAAVEIDVTCNTCGAVFEKQDA